jgi:tol-pal system protein YbgF
MPNSSPRLLAWVVPAVFGLSVGVGCAHQQPAQPKTEINAIQKMRLRLEEVEQTNGRLNVRIEELEDQIFLLQDMTESNRIALRRRGYMRRGTYLTRRGVQARAPGPTPESYSGAPSPYAAPANDGYRDRVARRANRNVTRIPLSRSQQGLPPAPPARPSAQPAAKAEVAPQQEEAVEVVITDEEFREFVGDPRPSSRESSSSRSKERQPQAPVTDEKLATSESLNASKENPSAAPAPSSSKNPLSIYKAALADYRSGSYAQALSGFKAFLKADPNPNYLDNGLYWIGECHYGLSDYQEAIGYFNRVLREQPDGNKVPDAILKMSLAYQRMGQVDRTRDLLEKLTDRFPTSNAGRLGAQKLENLPGE